MERVMRMQKFSNSPLISYTKLSPNHSGQRNHDIDTISIHCMAGNLTVEVCGSVFAPASRKASSNYGIGSDGRIGLYVEEKNRSWCTSSASNDNRAITIEVANDSGSPLWHVSDKALESLINLCVDICKRNSIKQLKFENSKALIGVIEKQNMTVHKWFANKACPGNYLLEKHPYIVSEVNKKLNEVVSLEMTKQELKAFIESTVRAMGTGEPADAWAEKEVANAKELGITDGSNPRRLATREEVMIMAARAAEK